MSARPDTGGEPAAAASGAPMRLLFDIPAFVVGGMERQIADLMAGLGRRGHEVRLVVNKSATDAYSGIIAAGSVPVTVLGRTNRLDPRVFTDLLGIVRDFRPHVVVAETFNASLWGRLAGMAWGTGVVVVEHSSERRASRKELWTNRLLGPFTHAVVGCAGRQVPSLLADGQPARAVTVVRNGVDTDAFQPDPRGARRFRAELGIPDDAFVVGMVAAHRREKRHDRFFELAERLAARDLDFVACAIGGGPLLEQNAARASASSAAERLRVPGPRTDLPAVYSACDAVVLLSDSIETFPLSFLEAQACGTPVVGMRVGGVEESFLPDLSGFLVEQGDLAAAADAIVRLAREPSLGVAMGRAGRRFVEEDCTFERMVSGYESVFRAAAASARGEGGG